MEKILEQFARVVHKEPDLEFALLKGLPFNVKSEVDGDQTIYKISTQPFKVEVIDGKKEIIVMENGKPTIFMNLSLLAGQDEMDCIPNGK